MENDIKKAIEISSYKQQYLDQCESNERTPSVQGFTQYVRDCNRFYADKLSPYYMSLCSQVFQSINY